VPLIDFLFLPFPLLATLREAAAMLSATFIAWMAGLKASVILHNRLLNRILKTPNGFFDITPTGRILARFSHDLNTIDDRLVQNMRQFLNTAIRVCF